MHSLSSIPKCNIKVGAFHRKKCGEEDLLDVFGDRRTCQCLSPNKGVTGRGKRVVHLSAKRERE